MGLFAKNFGLLLTAFLASVVLLSPRSRMNLHSLAHEGTRTVLATIPVSYDSSLFRIVKVKRGPSILIEIYRQEEGGTASLYSRFELPNSSDVYYSAEKNATNLFVADIDNDQSQEIIIPVLDQHLNSRLSVIKYAPESKSFSIF